MLECFFSVSSNNTNKLSPQELNEYRNTSQYRSNNTNKLSPQELKEILILRCFSSNNTNKLSPQELNGIEIMLINVQIIQINLVLKNIFGYETVQYQFK